MKIKDLHPDIERYLKEDCYCPHEIYSPDGFFYQLFYEDQDCEELGSNSSKSNLIGCVAHPDNNKDKNPQIVLFFVDDTHVYDSTRIDATENNLKIAKDILINGINDRRFNFDEYEEGTTAKALAEILAIADAIDIS